MYYNKEELTCRKLMNLKGLLHFVHKALKFEMTSLFPNVIRLLSRIVDETLEITSNQIVNTGTCPFELSYTRLSLI